MPVNVDAQLKPVILTPGELVAALSLCGYDTIATSLLQEHSLVASDEEADRFLFQAETLLRERGYFQESRPNFLPKGLESFIHVLVKSKRKCRCVSGVKKSFFTACHSRIRYCRRLMEQNIRFYF